MLVNSHIQIPNCILKHFRSSSSNTVYYLNLNDWRVHSCRSSSLGTEFGYYSYEMEQYLNKEIEDPIAKLAIKVNSFAERKKDKIDITYEDEIAVKKYVTASMARSKKCLNSYFRNSYFAALAETRSNHDSIALISTQRNGGVDPLVQNREVHLIVNLSNRQFVVPRNCFYDFKDQECVLIMVPISPICVIALVPEEYPKEYIDGEVCRLHKITEAETVWEMNKQALHYEWVYNFSFIASARKQELNELKLYLETDKIFH